MASAALSQTPLKQQKIDNKLANKLASKVFIYKGSITDLNNIDAVVSPTNNTLTTKNIGVSGVIFQTAGAENLEKACLDVTNTYKDNKIPTGQTVLTPAFNLHAKHILHTIPPGDYVSNTSSSTDKTIVNNYLQSCYITALNLCVQNNIKTVAFPCIGTGEGSFSKPKACILALEAVKAWLCDGNNMKYSEFIASISNKLETDDIFNLNIINDSVMDKINAIIFCCYDEKDWLLYQKHISKVYPISDKQYNYLWTDDNNRVNVIDEMKSFETSVQDNIYSKLNEYENMFKTLDNDIKNMNITIEKLLQFNCEKDKQIKILNDKLIQVFEEKNDKYEIDVMNEINKMKEKIDEMNGKIIKLDTDNKTLSKQEILKLFLVDINCQVYYNMFVENGYASVDALMELTQDDLKEIGVLKHFDRKQIIQAIEMKKGNKKPKYEFEGNTNYI